MKLLFLGDIVGRSGREAVTSRLPKLREDLKLDFVAVNGENAAGGFGITGQICQELYDAGADVVTTGNHVWDQRETLSYIEHDDRLLRPVNYPPGTPGRGTGLYKAANGAQVLVINVMGRVFMEQLDDPFAAVERELLACPLSQMADAIIVDVHAEASSEKMSMGHFCDGRASLVVGSHTHVPTADAQIFGNGTAYLSDAGMCGDYDSVLGMEKAEPISRFVTKISGGRFAAATGPGTLCGVFVVTDDSTGLARRIEPVRLGPRIPEARPIL
jgi:metallophosphoesterase (TIGR00282 family)